MGRYLTEQGVQIINLDLADPTTFFLNGGASLALTPFAPVSAPLAPTAALDLTAQAVFTDPGNPDGVALSQGLEYEKFAGSPVFDPPTRFSDNHLLVPCNRDKHCSYDRQ